MLKKAILLPAIVTGSLLISGCSVFNLQRFRNKVNSITDELFYPATITMPVLVTPTPSSTPTRVPTATATPTLTVTPTPTETVLVEYTAPTFEYLSTAELPISASDAIANVRDVTIPDDTILEPGQLFIKSWRMTNTGSNTWTEDTKLMMSASYDMDMPEVVKAIFVKPNDWIDFTPAGWGTRIFNVGPGTEADLAVVLKAPTEPGAYQIHFRLINPDGEIIPVQFWMRFAVSRPTDTPTPEPTSETPAPEVPVYDWTGRWMVREPYRGKEIVPANAWLSQNDDELIGLIYAANGDPIIVRGALTDSSRVFTGEIFYPWQLQTSAVTWRMQATRRRFYAVTPLGVVDDSAVCGARDDANLPESCALPAEG